MKRDPNRETIIAKKGLIDVISMKKFNISQIQQ